MVKITNGSQTFRVQEGAYDSIYSKMGFSKVDNYDEVEDAKGQETVNEEEDDFAELLEKPIGSWNAEEVKAFASAKNIDTSGAKKLAEAKAIVSDFIKENM